MTVYVDDMDHPFKGMLMSHMIADTDEELHVMADKIGMSRLRWQAPPQHPSHYDINQPMKLLALHYGARQINWIQCSAMTLRRKFTGELGKPEEARAWAKANFARIKAARSQ